MMSLEYIRELSRDAATKAAKRNLQPFFVEREDIEDWKRNLKRCAHE